MKHRSFPRSKRIVSGKSITLVLRKGGCAADDCLVVFALPRSNAAPNQSDTRLGVTIPKKVGNAVVRNRWKRWIRESFRTQQDSIPQSFDFVVRPKKGASGRWHAIRRSLPRLAQKAVRRI